MNIKSGKVPHGWRTEITDPDNEHRWLGNICSTLKASKAEAKKGFIENKKQQITAHEQRIKNIKSMIRKIRKL